MRGAIPALASCFTLMDRLERVLTLCKRSKLDFTLSLCHFHIWYEMDSRVACSPWAQYLLPRARNKPGHFGSRLQFKFRIDDTGFMAYYPRQHERAGRHRPKPQVGGTGAVTSTLDTTRESVHTLRRRSSDLLAASIGSTIPVGTSSYVTQTTGGRNVSKDASGEKSRFGICAVFIFDEMGLHCVSPHVTRPSINTTRHVEHCILAHSPRCTRSCGNPGGYHSMLYWICGLWSRSELSAATFL